MWGRSEGFWIKYQCILARNVVLKGFPGGSHSKESTCNAGRHGFDPWVGKIPWSREWQPTPVFLPGESPWTEEPGGLQSTGSQRARHDKVTKHMHTHGTKSYTAIRIS